MKKLRKCRDVKGQEEQTNMEWNRRGDRFDICPIVSDPAAYGAF